MKPILEPKYIARKLDWTNWIMWAGLKEAKTQDPLDKKNTSKTFTQMK